MLDLVSLYNNYSYALCSLISGHYFGATLCDTIIERSIIKVYCLQNFTVYLSS
jgi:hypothetical protein